MGQTNQGLLYAILRAGSFVANWRSHFDTLSVKLANSVSLSANNGFATVLHPTFNCSLLWTAAPSPNSDDELGRLIVWRILRGRAATSRGANVGCVEHMFSVPFVAISPSKAADCISLDCFECIPCSSEMNEHLKSMILRSTGATELIEQGVIQSLWSGYGSIVRYGLKGAPLDSAVVKHVSLPEGVAHPRGWNTDLSHQRKLKSYEVETAWYRDWSARCGAGCRVPRCLALESVGHELIIVLEDLDASGFAVRHTSVSEVELHACLSWLANFHATFMGAEPTGLWESGTYWHLGTRPDELAILAKEDPALKGAAAAIDRMLRDSRYQTLVHGDAKLANFCFSQVGSSVAAVDFQYVGQGCGMKDVAYLIGSCLGESECERQVPALLDHYFAALRQALVAQQPKLDVDAVEAEWRALYSVAWTDFHRFLKGWSPGHWKINGYSERLAREVVASLKKA